MFMENQVLKLYFNFEPFFLNIKEKGISENYLIREFDVSPYLLTRMKRGCDMRIGTVLRLMEMINETDIYKVISIS